ncbi:MAG: N-acetylmuramoyl-L-alanine amidase [Nitrospirae bacterium]|nr:N-acetylmuramoyl-L-alanine amidase [Nitrospirota bacterium]
MKKVPLLLLLLQFAHIAAAQETDYLMAAFEGDKKLMAKSGRAKSVVIDPGHGGPDYGIIKGQLNEKGVVLDIAKRIAALAGRGGFRASATRSGDHLMSFADRVNLSSKEEADIFLSLHVGNHQEIVIYVPLAAGPSEELKPYLAESGQHDYQLRTAELLKSMENALGKGFGRERVIAKPLPYSMLSRVGAAALLIELPSFDDASYSSELQAEIADAIYKGIENYEKLTAEKES